MWSRKPDRPQKYQLEKLETLTQQFQEQIKNKLQSIPKSGTPSDRILLMNKHLRTTATEILGVQQRGLKKQDEIEPLSKAQKELSIKAAATTEPAQREKIRKQRSLILKEIHKKTKERCLKYFDEKVTEVEKLKDSAKMFQAIKTLRATEPNTLFLQDEKKQSITHPQEQATTAAAFFQDQLQNPAKPPFLPVSGEPQPLQQPISVAEVRAAIKKLRNRRAAGPYEIPAELLKAAGDEVATELCDIINEVFRTHSPIPIGQGTLVPPAVAGQTQRALFKSSPRGPAEHREESSIDYNTGTNST